MLLNMPAFTVHANTPQASGQARISLLARLLKRPERVDMMSIERVDSFSLPLPFSTHSPLLFQHKQDPPQQPDS